MNFLPNEMLLEVFKHLSSSDLLALTYVCKNFNEIIIKSPLVERFQLNFRKVNESDEENVKNRNYKKLRVGFFKPNIHNIILNEIGANIVQLDFAFCKLKLDVIRKIFVGMFEYQKIEFPKSSAI